MARFSLSFTSVTATAFADTTALTDSNYPFMLQGASTTQRLNTSEIYIGGEAPSTSSPAIMVLGRDSTVAVTVSAGACRNAALDGSTTAPTAPTFGNSATTDPQRSATLHLLHLSFNAYGGIVRWVARPGEEISVVGNTASLGEVSLSAYTGSTSAAMSGHCIYEVA